MVVVSRWCRFTWGTSSASNTHYTRLLPRPVHHFDLDRKFNVPQEDGHTVLPDLKNTPKLEFQKVIFGDNPWHTNFYRQETSQARPQQAPLAGYTNVSASDVGSTSLLSRHFGRKHLVRWHINQLTRRNMDRSGMWLPWELRHPRKHPPGKVLDSAALFVSGKERRPVSP